MQVACNHLRELGIDTIQMIATTDSGVILKQGSGNVFAREGSVRSWLQSEEAHTVFPDEYDLDEEY